MNANTSSYVNAQRKSKSKDHSIFKSEYNPKDEIKIKIKQEKQKINYNIIENKKIKKENEYILEETNSYLRKKEEELNDIYKLKKDQNKNEIVNKDINENKINKNKSTSNINEYCDKKKKLSFKLFKFGKKIKD